MSAEKSSETRKIRLFRNFSTSAWKKRDKVPNCYKLRESLLWKDYPVPEHITSRNLVIGIPRVLSFWETMPFWSTFFRSLGFTVRVSAPSSHKLYRVGTFRGCLRYGLLPGEARPRTYPQSREHACGPDLHAVHHLRPVGKQGKDE